MSPMADTVENLILDLIEWVARTDHTYQETFDAWRTSCPRLTVWEDAKERGLLTSEVVNGRTLVRPTLAALSLLKERRRETYDQLRAQARGGVDD
jgi:hypothetical protein